MTIGLGTADAGRPRPFDLAALLDVAKVSQVEAALAFRVHRRQVSRWCAYGLTTDQADDAAVALGFHPSEVWPQWHEVVAAHLARSA